jgi:TATA-box binding protein (TBP) (component of TFIID and TFIIIB)
MFCVVVPKRKLSVDTKVDNKKHVQRTSKNVVGHVVDVDKVVDLHYITFLFNNFLSNYNPEQI